MKLDNVSDEFLEWLNSCPVQWSFIEQDKYSISYSFKKEVLQ